MSAEKGKVSLAVAKRLQAAGWHKETEWYWVNDGHNKYILMMYDAPSKTFFNPRDEQQWNYRKYVKDFFLAPTPTELGEVLPKKIKREKGFYYLEIIPTLEGWGTHYFHPQTQHQFHREVAPTLADAMGEMVIYLLQQGIIKPEEIHATN